MEILIFAIWVIASAGNAAIASEKERKGLVFFFASIILSPLLVYLYLLALPTFNQVERQQAMIENQQEIIRLLRDAAPPKEKIQPLSMASGKPGSRVSEANKW